MSAHFRPADGFKGLSGCIDSYQNALRNAVSASEHGAKQSDPIRAAEWLESTATWLRIASFWADECARQIKERAA